jgi:hypothetical protein
MNQGGGIHVMILYIARNMVRYRVDVIHDFIVGHTVDVK